MDVKREGVVEARQRKQRILYVVGAVLFLILAAWVLQLEPAAPSVDRFAGVDGHGRSGADAPSSARPGHPRSCRNPLARHEHGRASRSHPRASGIKHGNRIVRLKDGWVERN